MGKRIIHVDDDSQFREKIRASLRPIQGLDLVQVADQESFLAIDGFQADLYVFDRHLPNRQGGNVNDTVWRTMSGAVHDLYPEARILLVSSNPPHEEEWRKYKGIVRTMHKQDFNPEVFRELVESYLIDS